MRGGGRREARQGRAKNGLSCLAFVCDVSRAGRDDGEWRPSTVERDPRIRNIISLSIEFPISSHDEH